MPSSTPFGCEATRAPEAEAGGTRRDGIIDMGIVMRDVTERNDELNVLRKVAGRA